MQSDTNHRSSLIDCEEGYLWCFMDSCLYMEELWGTRGATFSSADEDSYRHAGVCDIDYSNNIRHGSTHY